MKRTFPALASLAIAALALGSAPASENTTSVIDLADLDLEFTSLPGEPQTYAIRMQGKSFDRGRPFPFDSTLTLRTAREGGNVVFRDTLDFAARSVSFSLVCEAEATLTPARGELRMDHAARSLAATLVRDDASDTLRVTTDAGTTSAIDFPDGTITQAALFRIVPNLPRTPGAVYTFPAYCPLNQVRPAVPSGADLCTLTCRGQRTITIDAQPVAVTEYVANFGGDLTFFVDANDVVRKVLADFAQTEMTLVPTPKPAFAEAENE